MGRLRWTVVLLLALCVTAPAQESTAKVARLRIRGNEHFSDRELRRVMTIAPGLFRKHRYHEGTLDSDLNSLLAVYENDGFLDASVSSRQVEPSADGESVEITVDLDEGPRTRITELTLTGARAIPEAQLRQRMRQQEGAAFRRQTLLTDRALLEGLYSEQGRIATRIGYEAVVDSAASAQVHYAIQEGPPVRVGDIVIDGLQKTRAYVVLRELKIGRGDLFRRSLLAETQTAVFSTGLFRSVTVGPVAGDKTDTVRTLQVTVRERFAGSLDMGVGYGSSERLRAGVQLAQTNWLGRGLRIGANARASRLVRTLEGVFTVPYVLGHKVALDGRMFHEWERNAEAGFRTQATGTKETFSYQWKNRWVSEVSYTLERVRLRFDDDEIYAPARTTSFVSLGLRRDSRDNPLDTRAGTQIRVRADVAGGLLQGDSDFNRSTVEVLHFRTLGFAVAAVHAQASGIDAAGDAGRVATYEQFYLGGDRSVRGYGRGEIGADRVGELAFNAQLELRLPLWRHGLVLFHDAGQVWTSVSDVDVVGDLRRASGAGLRYESRFGLLRFDVAVADRAGSWGERLGVYFGVGQAF
jgi:outer membrane protein insertion porin family